MAEETPELSEKKEDEVVDEIADKDEAAFPDHPDDFINADGEVFSFDYNRTVVGFHGTDRATAERLVRGEPFAVSNNHDDWLGLGHGIYFWEYGPRQAWWWAKRRKKDDAAVVGAMIRLGTCLDFLDPTNGKLLENAYKGLQFRLGANRGKFTAECE